MYFLLLSFGFFLLSLPNGYAQKYEWELINADNSPLLYNVIYCIEVDQNDHVWMGVPGEKNLVEWDGNSFQFYATPQPNVLDIEIDKNGFLWAALDLERPGFGDRLWGFDKASNSWQNYNSPRCNLVNALLIDNKNNIWFGNYSWNEAAGTTSYCGLYVYNRDSFTVYDTTNSGILYNSVHDILIDKSENVWVAHGEYIPKWPPNQAKDFGGISMFDGKNWTTFDTTNSALPHPWVNTLAMDSSGVLWIGTKKGLVAKAGSEWTVYTVENTPLPDSSIYDILVDKNDVKWISTRAGLVRYDNKTWEAYDSQNSLLPKSWVKEIGLDSQNNKYFATNEGLVILREGVNTSVQQNNDKVSTFRVAANYPNPFNPTTTIKYELPASGHVTIKIFDLTGRLVQVLAENQPNVGAFSAQWDGTNLSGNAVAAGIYIYRVEFVNSAGERFVENRKMSLVK